MGTDGGGVMADAALPYGMAVSILNSLDGSPVGEPPLMANWAGLQDPILGPGTRACINLSREIAYAQVTWVEAEDRATWRRATARIRDAEIAATRLLGEVCLETDPRYRLLTSIATSMVALAKCLPVTRGGTNNSGAGLGLACARGAVDEAETLGAWPLKAVAKALARMLEAASG